MLAVKVVKNFFSDVAKLKENVVEKLEKSSKSWSKMSWSKITFSTTTNQSIR